METLKETHQSLKKMLINKKNQNKEYLQTFIVVIFMISIMAFLMYFELKFTKEGNLQATIVALTGGLLMLATFLIVNKIDKKPFGKNPIITEQEINNLAEDLLKKNNTKLNEVNQYVKNLEILSN